MTRPTAPAWWGRATLRQRLTALFAASFLLAGVVLLAVTYLLVDQSLQSRAGFRGGGPFRRPPEVGYRPGGEPTVPLSDGRTVPISEAVELLRAEQEQYRQDTLTALLTRGAVALIVVGVVVGVAGWLLAGRALAPVHRITATARRIAGGPGRAPALHERIALAGPDDEIKELADTFDAMLDRLDRSFDAQRRFVSNASHELRTPLAINRALLEVATTRPDAPAQLTELGNQLLEVNTRHERLINGLLTLADSEQEIGERVPVDLAEIARHAIAQAAAEAGRAQVEIRPGRLGRARTTGDPVLLERLVSNLVENAVRHNHPGGWLEVATGLGTVGQVQFTVANTGPEVPGHEVDGLFQPFRRRGERTRDARGFGLGLPIVRALAQAHGGEVVATPRPSGGLMLTVLLPALADERLSGRQGL